MRTKKKQNPRIVFMIGLLVFCFVAFTLRAANFQVVTADQFALKNANLTQVSTVIPAIRGEIVDRYGRPIAINRDGYSIVFNSAYMKKSQYNDTIIKLTDLLSAFDTTWVDKLPMTEIYPYKFTDDKEALRLKNKLKLNDYATPENCYDEMVKKYNLENIDERHRRIVMGVRYSMDRGDFSVSNPFTFAEDISSDLMLTVSESFSYIPGIEINIVPYRKYTDSTLAPHIIGTIGKITAEEWETLKEQGYSYNEYVGKSGVEKSFEKYLRGENGILTYYFNKSGEVAYTEITKQPKKGNTVFLTIDSKLQKVAQNTLANNIEKLNSNGQKITGGSVVVTNVKTGQVITSANFPSYDLDRYSDYIGLDSSANNPLFDRALRGIYPPGSSFKPLVAVAGLEEGIIDTNTTIFCKKKYTYYDDYQPSCMHYHKDTNVIKAISKSCNYFFFDVGRRVGISKINEYAKRAGLGVPTGVELGESSGVLAGPDYSKKIGTPWYDGMTLAAAIGQSDNAFTPIQLANFTATIANGGTRYKCTLLDSVKDSANGEVVLKNTPLALDTLNTSNEVISTVKKGMHSVAEEGTASAYFKNYPISVGGKTGTAQTNGLDNSVFILFAPYENPEIALSVVVEHGEKSISTGPVAKAVLDEIFFDSEESDKEKLPNTLLN